MSLTAVENRFQLSSVVASRDYMQLPADDASIICDDDDDDYYDDYYESFRLTESPHDKLSTVNGLSRPDNGMTNGQSRSTTNGQSGSTTNGQSGPTTNGQSGSTTNGQSGSTTNGQSGRHEPEMRKSKSLHDHHHKANNTPFDVFDPFPELTRSRLAHMSARLYSPDETSSSSSLPTSSSTAEDFVMTPSDAGSPVDGCYGNESTSKFSDLVTFPEAISIAFYTSDGNFYSIEVDGATTVADVTNQLVRLNHSKQDPYWTVVECIGKFCLERSLEDHELVCPIFRSWHPSSSSSSAANQFLFRKDFGRYQLYCHPNQCFPEHMVDAELPKEETNGLMTRYERYRNLLLQNLLANQTMPDIQGFLHYREGKKKSWKKLYFVLRNSGLYYTTKGNVKDPKHLFLLSDLRDVNAYVAQNAKKIFSAPTQHCFCLAPQRNVNERQQLKQFCADSEQTRFCWLTGMRFVKYGSKLRDNFRASVRCNQSDVNENVDSKLNGSSLYVKNRVAMDFSGERGNVVADPNEALKVAKRECLIVTRAQTPRITGSSSQISRTPSTESSTSNLQKKMNQIQDWFHDSIGREETVSLMSSRGLVDGAFLVRHSESLPGVYVLSFVHNLKVKHCTIEKVKLDDCSYYSLDRGCTKFLDLVQLVDFYHLNAGPLPLRLTQAIKQ